MSNKYFGGAVSDKKAVLTEKDGMADEDLRLTAVGTLAKAAGKMEESI